MSERFAYDPARGIVPAQCACGRVLEKCWICGDQRCLSCDPYSGADVCDLPARSPSRTERGEG